MASTSLDLSQIKTDVLSTAPSFRSLIGLGSLATQSPTGTPSASNFLRGDYSWQTIDLSGYVPYTGANANLDLGTYTLTTKSATLSTGTITASTPAVDVSQTWNNAAVTFTASKLNVVDTASASGSNLIDLQLNSVSQFKVVSGESDINGGPANKPALYSRLINVRSFYGSAFILNGASANNGLKIGQNTSGYLDITQNGLSIFNLTGYCNFSCESANVLAQRNVTNAQTFRLYNTYTDASNYERAVLDWQTTSNVFRIGTEAGGTGTVRNIALVGGNIGIGTTSPQSLFTIANGYPQFCINRTTNDGNNFSEIQFAIQGTVKGYIWHEYNPINSIDGIAIGNGSGSTAFRVASDGSTSISAGPPGYYYNLGTYRLAVNGFGNTSSTYSATFNNNSGSSILAIRDDGNIGISTTSPSGKLHIVDTTSASSGSLANSTLNIATTWNTTGTPTLIKANITDTASNAASLLMDLQVGGSSKFKVGKNSTIYTNIIQSAGNGAVLFGYAPLSRGFAFSDSGYDFTAISTGVINWSSTENVFSTADLKLLRDAANTLAQRNSTNAQTFRLYRSYSTASDYGYTAAKQDATAGYILDSVNAGSVAQATKLLDLQLNGSSKLSVANTGELNLAGLSLFSELNPSSSYTLQINGGGQARFGFLIGIMSQFRMSRHGANQGMISWGGSDTNIIRTSTQDAGIYSSSPGLIEINNGSTGNYRDLILRNLTASGGSTAVQSPVLNLSQTWNSSISVTGASGNGTTATLTFSAMTTAFPLGSTIVVASVNPSGYNGTFTVTASSTTSVSYANTTTSAYVSGGAIQQQFTGLLYNATDTASASGSLLMDLQVGGVSKASISKTGYLRIGPGLYFNQSSAIMEYVSGYIATYGTPISCGYIDIGGGTNLFLRNDAAGILAQRNGTNSQTFRLYDTYTDASNYERLALSFSTYSSALYAKVQAESAGTGAANIPLVLTPKGNGAFILGAMPDGTATGGNARGQYAVDLQMQRDSASQVVSSNYGFAVGRRNTVTLNSANAAFGDSNTVSSGSYCSFAMGTGCTVTGIAAFATGRSCTSSGDYSFSVGGFCVASGMLSATIGYCNASQYGAFATGVFSLSNRYGMYARASGSFAGTSTGDAQLATFTVFKKTTDATPTTLMLDGDTTRLTIPSGKVFAFVAKISGIKSDGTAVAFYTRKGCIKNVGGTTTLVGNIETIGTDIEDNPSTDVAITADDTNDALQINVTGIATETWRWVAVVEGVEIGYGT